MNALLLLAALIAAQPPAQPPSLPKAAPDKVEVLLENLSVRVSRLTAREGDRIPLHKDPDHVVYTLGPCAMTLSMPDGKEQEVSLPAGKALFIEAVEHSAVMKKGGCALLIVELK